MGVFPCVVLLVLVWIGSAWFMRSGVQALRVCFWSAEGLTGRELCAVLRESRRPLWICGYFQVSGVPLLFVFGCLCLAVWVRVWVQARRWFLFSVFVLLCRWDRDRLGGFAVLLFVGIFGGFPGLDRLGAVLWSADFGRLAVWGAVGACIAFFGRAIKS